MSSISNSTYYNVTSGTTSSSSQGIAGLMSGMDTEAMVEEMLSGTQGKIDAQEALKQQTLWTQEIYRDVIENINSFYNSYFNYSYGSTLSTNFASDNFFNSMISSVTSGSAVSVKSTSTSASAGSYDIIVKQLASSAALTSSSSLSGDQVISGDIFDNDGNELLSTKTLTSMFEKNILLEVSGKEINVNLNEVTSEKDLTDAFNNAFKEAGVSGASAEIYDGKLRFITDSASTKVLVKGSASSSAALTMTGLTSSYATPITDATGATTGAKTEAGANLDLDSAPSFDLTLDGVTKTINLDNVVGEFNADGDYEVTAQHLLNALEQEVSLAFGDSVKVSLDTNIDGKQSLSFAMNILNSDGTPEAGHSLTITGSSSTLFGIAPGSSSNFSTNQSLSEVASGDRFAFTINGIDFSFDGSTSVASMINQINRSDAGVRLSYSSLSDKMTITASNSGSSYGIELSQSEGDLLSKLFGTDAVEASSTVSSNYLTTNTVKGSTLESDYTASGGAKFTLKVNNEYHTFTLPDKEDDPDVEGDELYTKTEIETALNSWLKDTFKSDERGIQNIKYNATTGSLDVQEGFLVEFMPTDIDATDGKAIEEEQKTDLSLAMGFNLSYTSNRADENTNISDVYGLETVAAAFGSATKLSDITSYEGIYDAKFEDGRLVITGTPSSSIDFAANPILSSVFGFSSYTFGSGSLTSGKVSEGLDAKLVINGVETTRSSNTFTIDGITMAVNSVSPSEEVGGETIYEKTTISTVRDDDSIVDAMKKFVEDYNKMIANLSEYVNADREYQDYDPLTSTQMEDMTEKQIELWEEKAKTGLVSGDSTINSFLSSLRTIMYTKPEGSSLALYQIGIETSSFYDDEAASGTLTFDEDAFRQALATDPESVAELFTSSAGGLSTQIDALVKQVANESSADPGTLVQLAGVEGKASDENNDMQSRLDNIEDMIETLKMRYELEYDRYWSQFSSMESILADYNTQSSYLASQFGTTY